MCHIPFPTEKCVEKQDKLAVGRQNEVTIKKLSEIERGTRDAHRWKISIDTH